MKDGSEIGTSRGQRRGDVNGLDHWVNSDGEKYRLWRYILDIQWIGLANGFMWGIVENSLVWFFGFFVCCFCVLA